MGQVLDSERNVYAVPDEVGLVADVQHTGNLQANSGAVQLGGITQQNGALVEQVFTSTKPEER